MTITYKILFSIILNHEYFSDDVLSSIRLQPTEDTLRTFGNYNLLWRQLKNKLVVGINSKGNNPRIVIPPDEVLRFGIFVDDSNFFNITNFNFQPDKLAYLSNLFENKTGSDLNLNHISNDYDGSVNYTIGSIVKSGTDVYEAIKPGSGNLISDNTAWFKRAKSAYVNSTEYVASGNGILNIELPAPVSNVNINIYYQNSANKNSEKLISCTTQKFTDPVSSLQIDMSKYRPGKYRISCNGIDYVVYLDESLTSDCIGIIEIFNNLNSTSDFSLFNSVGEMKSPVFRIRFANRLAYWKYRNRRNKVTGITDNDSNYTFIKETSDIIYDDFISDKPVPLSDATIDSFVAQSVLLGDVSPLKCPDPNRINIIVRNGSTYHCSEIYLNF